MVSLQARTAWLNDRLAILGHDPVTARPAPQISILGADGTEDSQDAGAWVALLTSTVHLVYAETCGHGSLGAAPAALDALSKSARFAFDLVAPALQEVSVKEHVLDASPARALVDVADGVGTDLIAVGSRSHAIVDTPGLGSVSETLVHHAPYPVLLARRPPRSGPVVLALGEDRSSRQAASWALRLAEATNRELIVLHSAPEDLERLELEGFTDRGKGVRGQLVAWPPEEGLARFLEDRPVSLLVLGHGRHRSWLGSTALKMLRSASTAVLVVPWRR